MALEEFLPKFHALKIDAERIERTDDPGVHLEFILQLPRRPAGIADVGGKLEASVLGQLRGLFLT